LEELEQLRNLSPTIIDREVIKEIQVPYEVVKEIQVVKEVIVEVPVEVIREVLVEKKTSEDTQRLHETLGKLRQQSIDKDVKIKELEDEINSLKSLQQQHKAVYLRGSNLDNKLYK
jgi:cell shape-determining protein MreC